MDLDFCSITIDGDLNNDILQQRLRELAKQREELQLMEIELRAQNIARSEIARIHSNFDAQITEHGNANVKLQVLHFLCGVYMDVTICIYLYASYLQVYLSFRSNCTKRNRTYVSWRERLKRRIGSCMLLDWTMKRLVRQSFMFSSFS